MRNRKNRRRIIVRAAAVCEGLEARRLLTAEVVNTVIDGIFPPNSGTVSLRSAIIAANSSATPTMITFDPNVFASPQTIVLNGTQLPELTNSSDSTTIQGPSAGITVSGHNLSGALQIATGVSLSLSNCIITNGGNTGINNAGTLTLTNVTISNFTATNGAGLLNSGIATLTNTTISGNSTTFQYDGGNGAMGAGIANSGTLTILDSSLLSNTSNANGYNYGTIISAGGIYNDGTLVITNSTIAGNVATTSFSNGNGRSAGAIYNDTSATTALYNVTIDGNTASGTNNGYYGTANNGGGIYNVAAGTSFNIENTIVAGDTGTSGADAYGPFNSLGYNLCGITNGSTGFNGLDLTGTAASPLNAELGLLADNGGLTQTLLPLLGSPVIAQGNVQYVPSGITTDQRGQPRIVNGTVDIGAVETGFNPVPLDAPTLTSPAEGSNSQPVTPTFTWSTVTGATQYRIILATNQSALLTDRSATTDTDPSVVFNQTVPGTSFTPLTALQNSTAYYWEVIGNNSTTAGTWSADGNFETALAAPTPTSPADQATMTGGKPTFTWTAVPTATQYRLVVATQDSNLPTQSSPAGSSLAIDMTVTTNSYTPSTELTGNATYGWEVIGFNSANGGTWSSILHFTTGTTIVPIAPTLAGPLNLSTDQSLTPTFIWSLVAGASQYRLLVAANESDLPTDPTATAAGPSGVIDITTSGTSYTPTMPLAVTTPYFWEVIGTNTNGGAWSQIFQFTTGDPTIVRTGSAVAVTGTSSGDTASVSTAGSNVTFTIDGLSRTFAASKIASTVLTTGAGNDTVDITGGPAANVNGGGGDDLIVADQTSAAAAAIIAASENAPLGLDQLNAMIGGAAPAASGASSVTVMGGTGNDTIVGGSGASLSGGTGNDLFLNPANSTDTIDGGTGLNFALQPLNGGSLKNIFEVLYPSSSASPSIAAPAARGVGPAAAAIISSVDLTQVLFANPININAGAGNDNIFVRLNLKKNQLVATDNGVNIPLIPTFPILAATGISVSGGAGNDTVTIDPSVTLNCVLNGGAGNDSLIAGAGALNVLIGGAGNDTLAGGSGVGAANLLLAGKLADLPTGQPVGTDRLIGGANTVDNIADFTRWTINLNLTNDGVADSGNAGAGEISTIQKSVQVIYGGAIGQDTLTGTTAGEQLTAGFGASELISGGDSTKLFAGPPHSGTDTVVASGNSNDLELQNGVSDDYSGVNSSDILHSDGSPLDVAEG
jgi:hypothetical protein